MPLRIGVDPLNRVLVAVAVGEVTLPVVAELAHRVLREQLLGYGKVIDLMQATQAVSEIELAATARFVREAEHDGPCGPLAVVADRVRGEFARHVARVELCGRPAEIFASLHAARQWVAQARQEAMQRGR